MRYWFRRLNLKIKLLLSYLVLIVIPITLVATLSFYYSSKTIEDIVTQSFQHTNRQISERFDSFYEDLANITLMVYYNEDIMNILNNDYTDTNNARIQKAKDYMYINTRFFEDLKRLHNRYIDSIVLYKPNTDTTYFYNHSTVFNYRFDEKSPVVIKDGKENIQGIHKKSPFDESYVVTVERLIKDPNTKKILGVICINVNINSLRLLWNQFNFTPNTEQMIIDDMNKIVQSSNRDNVDREAGQALIDSFSQKEKVSKFDYMGVPSLVVSSVSGYCDWKVVSIIPVNELYMHITKIRQIIFVMGIVLIFVSIITSFIVAQGISRPLRKLSDTMENIDKNSFSVKLDIPSDDEIGNLAQTFNRMSDRILQLMNNLKKEEEEKRVAEINALQSQINPHFINNTLSLIKWMADVKGNKNIVKTVDDFVYILNFSMQETDNFTTIENEVKFVQSYINILQTRYINRFFVEYDIDRTVFHHKILKFVLQPLIENAIFHGFETGSSENLLQLSIKMHEGIICIVISDNGIGMSADMIQKFLKEDNKTGREVNSIGIKNTVNRLNLHFGKQYNLVFKSLPGQGTKVILDLPIVDQYLA